MSETYLGVTMVLSILIHLTIGGVLFDGNFVHTAILYGVNGLTWSAILIYLNREQGRIRQIADDIHIGGLTPSDPKWKRKEELHVKISNLEGYSNVLYLLCGFFAFHFMLIVYPASLFFDWYYDRKRRERR